MILWGGDDHHPSMDQWSGNDRIRIAFFEAPRAHGTFAVVDKGAFSGRPRLFLCDEVLDSAGVCLVTPTKYGRHMGPPTPPSPAPTAPTTPPGKWGRACALPWVTLPAFAPGAIGELHRAVPAFALGA